MLNSPIEEIKNRLDILEVIKDYVQLQKAGGNWRGLCPFHAEKSPSFFVSPSRQLWHCFGGCGEGGDVFKFVMKAEGIEFGECLRLLAERARVELPKRDFSSFQEDRQKKRLFEVLEWATRFFETQLESSERGREAKEYLAKRGVHEESMELWRIGYAPDSVRSLHDFLVKKGYQQWEIGRAGLLLHAEGQTYDRFRGRIMFPVCNAQGQVAGFGGRIFGRKEGRDLAKYLNTSNTPCYDKSRILYGLDKAKLEIRRQDACILVEGYTDAIMAHQAGWKNTVATSGTALTDEHLRIMKRYTQNLIASFDHDSAGEHATKRSIAMALGEGFRVRVVMMPQGQDPADVASQNPELWGELVQGAKSIYDFFFDTALSQYDKTTPEGKADIAREVLPVIQKIGNTIEQAHWIQRLARELGVPEGAIREEMKKGGGERDISPKVIKRGDNSSEKEEQQTPGEPKTRKDLLEEHMLALVLRQKDLASQLQKEERTVFSPKVQEILEHMGSHPEDRLEDIFPRELADALNLLSFQSEVEEEEVDIQKEFQKCVEELANLSLRVRLDNLASEIQTAEEAQDGERMNELMDEFSQIAKKFHAL